MSDYSSPPLDPTPEERRMERGCRRLGWGIGLFLLAALLAGVYGLVVALWPAGEEERAKPGGPPPGQVERSPRQAPRPFPRPPTRPPGPPVPPRKELPPPKEVPMGAQAVSAPQEGAVTLPGFMVAGEFSEPPMRILTRIDGRERITLAHLLTITPEEYRKDAQGRPLPIPPPIDALVEELRLVNPKARHSALGTRVGQIARRVAAGSPRNSRFLPSAPRVACAAFTSYILVKAGGKRHSYAVNTAYPQLKKRGGKIVAARVSTKYAGYMQFYRPGDFLFFHKGGNRLGHMEIYVGGGLTAGTSSSMLRVGIRRVGNRGFRLMTVLRI